MWTAVESSDAVAGVLITLLAYAAFHTAPAAVCSPGPGQLVGTATLHTAAAGAEQYARSHLTLKLAPGAIHELRAPDAPDDDVD